MTTTVYRERRRLAKLRRRARNRDSRARLALSPCVFANCANWKDPAWRGSGWWATTEGRRRWLEDDRARKRFLKRERREAMVRAREEIAKLPRETPAEMFNRVVAEMSDAGKILVLPSEVSELGRAFELMGRLTSHGVASGIRKC